MNFGKSISQIQMNPDTGVTFEDDGCDQAKLGEETVDFLKNHRWMQRNKNTEGSSGWASRIGKTLAGGVGEMECPFSQCGSEFVEMFGGVVRLEFEFI